MIKKISENSLPSNIPRTIALILPNWVGDAVMATPAIRAIRQTYPGSVIIGVGRPHIVTDLLEGVPWFDQIIPWERRLNGPKGLLATSKILRQFRPDWAILFPNSFRAAVLARLGCCQQIIGFARYGRFWLLHRPVNYPRQFRKSTPHPIIDDYNHLAQAVGTPHPGYRMELYVTPQHIDNADLFWRSCKLDTYSQVIMFHCGAAYGSSKLWPIDHFAQLARWVTQCLHAAVVILHGPQEESLAAGIVRASRSPHVFHVGSVAPPSLGLTKALLRRAAALVTTDSGPRHIAAALGRPVVTLFGPTHIAWTETYYEYALHLQKKVSCGPCQKRQCPEKHHLCMKALRPEEVFDALIQILGIYNSKIVSCNNLKRLYETRHAA
ncbi:MAG: lipopolysaccharide heptosyltransferase II [Thermogemmata sp.]